MNNDRLLTRVFDKQEQKMLYSKPAAFEDDYEYTTIATFGGHKLDYRLVGLNGDFINFVTKQNVWLPYHNEDRFETMMCTGQPDKNKKLIYAGDILRIPPEDDWDKINFASYEVFFHDNDSCDCHIGFRMNRVHYHGSACGGWVPNFNPKTTSRMEIIHNIHENEKLLEVKA